MAGKIDFLLSGGGNYLYPITLTDAVYLMDGSLLSTKLNSFQTQIDNKQPKGSYANASHSHAISEITNLQTTLDNKQPKGSYAAASHTHTIANITNLQTTLDGKQPSGSYSLTSHLHDDRYVRSDVNFIAKRTTDFKVNGNANTYYPVLFYINDVTYRFMPMRFMLGRGFSEPAPDTWNTATHRGGLSLELNISGDSRWGGNGKEIVINYLNQQYSTMIANMCLTTSEGWLCIWLRGGGADYHCATSHGAIRAVPQYSTFTDSSGTKHEPKTAVNGGWQESYMRANLFKGYVNSTKYRFKDADGQIAAVQSGTPNTGMLWAW